MAIPKVFSQNFNTLLEAVRDGNVALMECTNQETEQPVYVICAVEYDGSDYTFVPFAKLFDGDPYEEVTPPVAD